MSVDRNSAQLQWAFPTLCNRTCHCLRGRRLFRLVDRLGAIVTIGALGTSDRMHRISGNRNADPACFAQPEKLLTFQSTEEVRGVKEIVGREAGGERPESEY